ncbi:hypothetical protein CJU89_4107 [Yarrowia sp. B02]|nr:hypothetical protein CJU89_4107 [Yarrowia sp. B02]
MLLKTAVLVSLVSSALAIEVDLATITRGPTTLVPTYVPLAPLSIPDGLIYVGEESDAPWIDEDNITYLDGDELHDGADNEHESIDIIDDFDDGIEYDENGLYIEYDNSELEREEETPPPPPQEEWEWDESGQMWKKKECCETVYKFKTQTKWVKQKPVTKVAWKTRNKTMMKTVIKTAYQTITKTYKLPRETTTVKFAVTTTKTFKLPKETLTMTKVLQRDPVTVTSTRVKSETYHDIVTKTYQRDHTYTETETVAPSKDCKGKDYC